MSKKKPIKQTMKHKGWVGFLMVLQALPIPVTLFSVPFSLITAGNIEIMMEISLGYTVCFLATMILAGTYTVTYIVSLALTVKTKKLSILTFLPLIQLALTAICLFAGIRMEQAMYL